LATGREYAIVLFGATGFTGGLTAEYLATAVPPDVRWALAGRNRAKLEAVRDRLAGIHARYADLPLLVADSGDPASLRAVAESAGVVITTVGPYLLHGEPLVAACAAAGTDYVDLTGEPEFTDRMYLAHHETARKSGARLVHACGFDSVPHDLGAWYTVRQLPDGVPLQVNGYVRASGMPSGGTLASAMLITSRMAAAARVAKERAAVEDRPSGRTVDVRPGRPHRVRETGWWAVPMPTIDPEIVGRSALASPRYGPEFTYRHFAAFQHLPVLAGAGAGMGALAAASLVPPARRAISRLLAPGKGPSPARRARSWFAVRFHGEGGGKRVVTEVSGGDPGYGETAKMLAESALCLALDDLPETSGQVTTAAAMGDALIDRLCAAGLRFRTLT
jgi:short subunit dehydrogenase-like uncharacterized protein